MYSTILEHVLTFILFIPTVLYAIRWILGYLLTSRLTSNDESFLNVNIIKNNKLADVVVLFSSNDVDPNILQQIQNQYKLKNISVITFTAPMIMLMEDSCVTAMGIPPLNELYKWYDALSAANKKSVRILFHVMSECGLLAYYNTIDMMSSSPLYEPLCDAKIMGVVYEHLPLFETATYGECSKNLSSSPLFFSVPILTKILTNGCYYHNIILNSLLNMCVVFDKFAAAMSRGILRMFGISESIGFEKYVPRKFAMEIEMSKAQHAKQDALLKKSTSTTSIPSVADFEIYAQGFDLKYKESKLIGEVVKQHLSSPPMELKEAKKVFIFDENISSSNSVLLDVAESQVNRLILKKSSTNVQDALAFVFEKK